MKYTCVKHAAGEMFQVELAAPSVLLQPLLLLQWVLRSLEGVALTHLYLHQEHPMTLLLHPAGSWSSPGSQADHSSPYFAGHSLVAAVVAVVDSAALSAAAEQSSAVAESAAAAC